MARQKVRHNSEHDAPVPGFSQAVKVRAEGTLVFISGLLARRHIGNADYPWYESVLREEDAKVEHQGDIEGQARQAFEAIKTIVAFEGGSLDDVVRIVIYLTDMNLYPPVARVRREYFGDEPPASTCVQVARLYDTRQLIEVEATAMIPDSPRGAVG